MTAVSPSNASLWTYWSFPPSLALIFFFFFKQQEPETAPSQLLLFHQTGVAPAGSSHSWLRQQTQSKPCCYKSRPHQIHGTVLSERGRALGLSNQCLRTGTEHMSIHRISPTSPSRPSTDKEKCPGCKKTLSQASDIMFLCYLWYHHTTTTECKLIKGTINMITHPTEWVSL